MLKCIKYTLAKVQIFKIHTNSRSHKQSRCYSSGTYTLKCQGCDKFYTLQTDKTLNIRHNKHIRYARSNNPQVAYAIYALNNGHEYGAVDEIMQLAMPFRKRV